MHATRPPIPSGDIRLPGHLICSLHHFDDGRHRTCCLGQIPLAKAVAGVSKDCRHRPSAGRLRAIRDLISPSAAWKEVKWAPTIFTADIFRLGSALCPYVPSSLEFPFVPL